MIVVIKLMAPRIDDTLCRKKIARSTDGPAWARFPVKGGSKQFSLYQPQPQP